MSTLTRMVKNNAALFGKAVVNPVGQSSLKMAIEPKSSSLQDATLAGHAFDLWLRCWLASRDVIDVEPSSVPGFPCTDARAEHAADVIRRSIKRKMVKGKSVLRACLTLASFEMQFRSGIFVEESADRPSAIGELRWLTERANLGWLAHAKQGISNPVFGLAHKSGRRICADGDLLLDDNLVDIKTARRRNKQMEAWRQLAGYVVLNSMRPKPLPIKRVTLWYVRFGEPWIFPVDAVFKPGGQDWLRRFFESCLVASKASNPVRSMSRRNDCRRMRP